MRFQRQTTLSQIGVNGQTNLIQSRVLIVGMGGLGNPVAMYLASAGVGHITLIDHDKVDISNLHRQILFQEADIGQLKVEAAKAKLLAMNSQLNVQAHAFRLTKENASAIISGHNLVIDCTDDFQTKQLINDTTYELQIPFVYGSIDRFEGHVGVFNLPNGPCFRCLFAETPRARIQTCESAGVIGSFAGIIAGIQATEAILYLAKNENVHTSKLIHLDFNELPKLHSFTILKNSQCSICAVKQEHELQQNDLHAHKAHAPEAIHSHQ